MEAPNPVTKQFEAIVVAFVVMMMIVFLCCGFYPSRNYETMAEPENPPTRLEVPAGYQGLVTVAEDTQYVEDPLRSKSLLFDPNSKRPLTVISLEALKEGDLTVMDSNLLPIPHAPPFDKKWVAPPGRLFYAETKTRFVRIKGISHKCIQFLIANYRTLWRYHQEGKLRSQP